MTQEWNRQHLLPSDDVLTQDYLLTGLHPNLIVRALQAIELRSEKHKLHWTLCILGLALPLPSYWIHPTNVVFWSRLLMLSLALTNLGRLIWPTGFAAQSVLWAVKGYHSNADMRRRPFRYAGRFIGGLLLLIACVVLAVVLVVYLVQLFHVSMNVTVILSAAWKAIVGSSPYLIPLCALALGVQFALHTLRKESANLDKAANLVAEILEWKREEFFERKK